MLYTLYYYDANIETLSAAILPQAEVYAGKYDMGVNGLKIFVREDEITSGDDFGDLNITRLTKGLQPSHYMIAKSEREPKILKGVRVSV